MLKTAAAILLGILLGIITNLISNLLAPKAERRNRLVWSTFLGLVALTLTVAIIPDAPTGGQLSTPNVIEVSFELPRESEPAIVDVVSQDGKTRISINIESGTRQTIKLPPGSYTYTVRSQFGHTIMPCTYLSNWLTASFSTDKVVSSIILPRVGTFPIPQCTPNSR